MKRMVQGMVGMAAVLLGGCASHTVSNGSKSETALPAKTGYEVLKGEIYTPDDWPVELVADVYKPEGAGDGPSYPAVLVVHGGGWTRRSPSDMDSIAKDLAKRGLVVINVAYRFAPQHRFPTQLEDLQQAMRWIVENHQTLGVDLDRIGAYGYSAGAHLVALLATVDRDDPLTPAWARELPKLKAVVAGGTPTDLRKWPNSQLVRGLIGAERDAALDTWAAASPITHVNGNEPPFFLYHGGLDKLVEPDQAKDMQAALAEAGVRTELFIKPLHGHVSMFLFGAAVEQATRFLVRELAAG
ncbi:MAG: alpha/beta hydrolase [Pseudomonadota bacterium]